MSSRSTTRSRSLARSIPVALSAGLAVVICAYATVTYLDLRRVMVEHEESRLLSVSDLVARLASQSVRGRVGELVALGEYGRLIRATRSGDSATVAGALQLLTERAEQEAGTLLSTEIHTADGLCRLSVWRDEEDGPLQASQGCPLGVAAPDLPLDSPGVSPLTRFGDQVHFSYSVPVGEGRLIEHRLVTDNTATGLIAGLIGADAALVIGNRDGSYGTEGVAALSPGMIEAPSEPSFFSTDAGRRIGVGSNVREVPLTVWVHRDVGAVLAPVREALVHQVFLGLGVLLLGSLGAVVLSRRLTGPLREITVAADDLRAGAWNRRLRLDRDDELGRLGRAFNSMAAALEASHTELEQRVSHRTAELQKAMDQLAEAQDELLKRERLAVLGQLAGGVAHELRSPLGVMTNSVYYLRAVLTELPARSADYLDILDRQIEIAKKIISDLLDYARVRPAHRKATSLTSVITDVLATAPREGKIDIRREIHPDAPPALVDSDQVRQVILNIVTNALQAVEDTPDATVTIRVLPHGENGVVVEVEDNGPGIHPGDRKRIFEPLYSTKPKGIGLGLAVSRALALANHGDLAVDESPGGGASFRLRLPAAAAEPSRSSAPVAGGVS